MLHQIGAGALGPVFRAYDPEQDKLVAVKLFRLDVPPERVHQLVGDLQRLVDADLTHPSIAAPLAAGISGVSAYLAQDFVAADSLDTVVREHGPAPAGEALRTLTQLADALDVGAAAGIVHGALHPRDVLMSPDDARLTGLGVTRALERIGWPPPIRRPYTAPERAAAAAWDRRADVFSLAALAHELLWGRRVTATGAQAAAALGELTGARHDTLRVAFARALADDPANRFETARAFADALKSAFSLQVPVDPRRTTNDERRTWSTERRTTTEPLLPLESGEADDTVETPPPEDDDATVPEDRPMLANDDDTVDTGDDEKEQEDDFDIAAVLNRAEEADAPDGDLLLRPAEAIGFEDVETAPSMVNPPIDPHGVSGSVDLLQAPGPEGRSDPPPLEQETGPAISQTAPSPPSPETVAARAQAPVVPAAASEPPAHRSTDQQPTHHARRPTTDARRPTAAVWPLALTLIVGIALGFAGGYWLGSAEHGSEKATAAVDPRTEVGGTEVRGTEVRLKADPTPAPPPTLEASVAEPPPAAAAAMPAAAVKPAAAVATGRLTIRSTPAGARVFVDGRDAGKTPITVRDLARGTHTVRISRDGYTTQERRVEITAARPGPSLTVRLPRATAASAAAAKQPAAPLVVESRPPGATVFLDGKRLGTTPMSIPAVNAGSHTVRLELNGYTTWSSSVRVLVGEKNRIAASLDPVKR